MPADHLHRGSAFLSRLLVWGISPFILSEAYKVRLQGGWQNRILARLSNEMSRYNPIHYVSQVKAPVLMVATTRDALCSIHLARRAASLNPLVKLVEKDAGKHGSDN